MPAPVKPRHLPTGVWVAAGGVVTVLLALSGRYGFHRDELYFIVAGRRLDWGYVDQPPFTPLIARISETIGGTNPTALRVLPALAVGLVAVVAALMARRFGGGHVAQVFAAITAGLTGVLLGEGHLLSTAVFDYALWVVGFWIVIGLLDGDDARWWLALGLVVGVGMQNKHSIAFFAVAILLALLFTEHRRLLTSRYPWMGAMLAAVIAAPNLIWQAANGWPQLEMAEALRARSDGPLVFVLFQPLLLSITLAIPATVGLWWLARSPQSKVWRPISIAIGILFVAFLVTGAKPYYFAPVYPVLLAAGAVWFERLGSIGRRWTIGLAATGIAVGVVIALPVVPEDLVSTIDATGELGETVGWPELVAQVSDAYARIPPDRQAGTVVFTSSYGEGGAVDVLGPAAGLPPAVSGHNNYWMWGPPERHGPIIGVGYVRETLAPICPDLVMVGELTNPWGVENEVMGSPLYLCLNPVGQLGEIWDSVRHYN